MHTHIGQGVVKTEVMLSSLQDQECQWYQRLKEAAWRDQVPANPLILDFWSPELRKNEFLVF
jgi:hypothetical protein